MQTSPFQYSVTSAVHYVSDPQVSGARHDIHGTTACGLRIWGRETLTDPVGILGSEDRGRLGTIQMTRVTRDLHAVTCLACKVSPAERLVEYFGPTNRVDDGPQNLYAVRDPRTGEYTGPLYDSRREAIAEAERLLAQ